MAMRIFMETDAVRGMAAKARQTADDLDGRNDALLSQIENMEWQSNARTEFDGYFKGIHRNIKTIANAMRLMGSAADAKATQWEAIASKLLGPFVAVQNFWQSAIDHMGLIVAILIGIWLGRLPRWAAPGSPRIPGDDSFIITPKLPDWWKRPRYGPGIEGPSWKPGTPGFLPQPVGGGSAGGGSGGGGAGSSTGGDGSTGGGGSANAPTEGIPSSRTPADKLAILGGCTNYVATKRDVSGFWKPGRMNATYWNENATAAGFEVGNKPVAGSIMVIEADNGTNNGIMNVHDTAGHVLCVESVKETAGGYLVSYSHAGTLYNDAGNYIPGTYKMLNNSKPVFVPYESPVVSFIYDKA
jgi:surface antigen/uncharacterized protein YukE